MRRIVEVDAGISSQTTVKPQHIRNALEWLVKNHKTCKKYEGKLDWSVLEDESGPEILTVSEEDTGEVFAAAQEKNDDHQGVREVLLTIESSLKENVIIANHILKKLPKEKNSVVELPLSPSMSGLQTYLTSGKHYFHACSHMEREDLMFLG